MSTVAFVGEDHAVGIEQSPITVTTDPCTEGDVLIAVVTSWLSEYGPSTGETGWTLLFHEPGQPRLTAWWRYADAADAAGGVDYTFQNFGSSNNANRTTAALLTYSGVTEDPVGLKGGKDQGTSTPPNLSAGSALLGLHAGEPPASSRSTEAGSTTRVNDGGASTGYAGNYLTVNDFIPGGANTRGPQVYTTWNNNYTFVNGTVVLVGNEAPYAPALSGPADAATLNRANVNRFSWAYSDPNPGDSQSKFDLRYRKTSTATWTTVTVQSPFSFWDAAAGTFDADDYEWQVRVYDSLGVAGPWSASRFFTAADAPTDLTITSPINGSSITTTTALVTWSTPTQESYQVRILDAGSATIYDSGEQALTNTRRHELSFSTNGATRTIEVRIKKDALWSAWVGVTVTVDFTPPPVPSFTLTPNENGATMLVDITNPAPGAGEPAVIGNEVYVDDDDGKGETRRAVDVAANGTWLYRTPRGGVDYDTLIRVVAVGDNGTTTSS